MSYYEEFNILYGEMIIMKSLVKVLVASGAMFVGAIAYRVVNSKKVTVRIGENQTSWGDDE
jgi:hypothetical protein